ncbi:MAG: 3'-5' exonuclease [Lentisphaerae bacterium]|nr:3'-5' exonuclease [Lentisphaerota bacterium]
MSNLQLYRPLAVLDIEATGTNPQSDRLIDLAIVRIMPDGRHDPHTFRVNPGIPIPEDSARIHGIRDADVRDCPLFKDVAAQVNDVLANCDLGGFNVLRFDIPMLIEEFGRVGIAFDISERRIVDAQRIFHRREPRDLTAALSYYCQEMHLGAHGAMADADATVRVLEAQLKRYPDLPRDVAELDAYCNPRDPGWVDREGRLKWAGSEIVVNFGKKKGESLRALLREDPGFIKWMMRSNFPKDVKQLIEDGQRGVWPPPPPPAAPTTTESAGG